MKTHSLKVTNHLTTKQAAKSLGVSAPRVRQLILAGRLPAVKFGRDLMILKSDLKRVMVRKPGRPKLKSNNERHSPKVSI